MGTYLVIKVFDQGVVLNILIKPLIIYILINLFILIFGHEIPTGKLYKIHIYHPIIYTYIHKVLFLHTDTFGVPSIYYFDIVPGFVTPRYTFTTESH